MKTEDQLYADEFAFRTWVLDPADFLVPVPADAAAIVDAYMVAAIEHRSDAKAVAK